MGKICNSSSLVNAAILKKRWGYINRDYKIWNYTIKQVFFIIYQPLCLYQTNHD